MAVADVLKQIKKHGVKFVDFRFTDTKGKEQHVSVPVSAFSKEKFTDGHAFDGSSIAGWKGINASDMLLIPDPDTATIDPFMEETTLALTCNVIDPTDGKGYDRDPRTIANRAEAYLKSTKIGDAAYFGPEPEFFVFDSVTWQSGMSGSSVKINSEEATWDSNSEHEGGNVAHRPAVKGGSFPVPPVDSMQDLRSAMCLTLEEMGIPVEVHHHEVGGSGQNEIGTKFSTLTQRADWTQKLKYVELNTAHNFGKTATFMPKPVFNDNGTGMHVHHSIWKGGKNMIAGKTYAGLSETDLYQIGGIIKQGRALNQDDNINVKQVAVLGEDAALALFPTQDPIGQFVKLNHFWLEVVGVLQNPQINTDDFQGVKLGGDRNTVFIPLSTSLKKLDKRAQVGLSQQNDQEEAAEDEAINPVEDNSTATKLDDDIPF